MKRRPSILLGVVVIVIGLSVWGIIERGKELGVEKQHGKPVKVAARVVPDEDGTAVVLDSDTQKRADIAVAAAQRSSRRPETEALAMVLPLQELIDLRNSYVAAKAQTDRAFSAENSSHREYDRIAALNRDGHNASDKALEGAQAAWRNDEAAATTAHEAMETVERGARQKWGATLASAFKDDAPLYRRLTEQREVLLRVAAPAGSIMKPPTTVRLDTGDGAIRIGQLISLSPQVDPRIQGASFFYAAPIDGLLPGTTLTAYLPSGTERTGGIVPAEAVVWWQGKAWFYVQSAPDRFVRHELVDAMPLSQGWFVPSLEAIRLVVRGAQTLLSEELRSQIRVGEDD